MGPEHRGDRPAEGAHVVREAERRTPAGGREVPADVAGEQPRDAEARRLEEEEEDAEQHQVVPHREDRVDEGE